MPASHLLIFSKMVSPGTQVQDPVLCMVKFKIISAAWGKICGQIPQRGDSRSVQILQLCSYPPPPTPYPLRLNIDTCINKQPNKSNNKLTPYQPVYRRPPAEKKSIEEKSIINRVPVYIQLTEKKNNKKITMQILHNFFWLVFFL